MVFDAVVEVRPTVSVPGYASLRVEIAKPEASAEEIDAQIERLRQQYGELTAVERPAIDADHVTITINGSRDGEPIAGLQADDYLYEVGTGSLPTSSTTTFVARRSATSCRSTRSPRIPTSRRCSSA